MLSVCCPGFTSIQHCTSYTWCINPAFQSQCYILISQHTWQFPEFLPVTSHSINWRHAWTTFTIQYISQITELSHSLNNLPILQNQVFYPVFIIPTCQTHPASKTMYLNQRNLGATTSPVNPFTALSALNRVWHYTLTTCSTGPLSSLYNVSPTFPRWDWQKLSVTTGLI